MSKPTCEELSLAANVIRGLSMDGVQAANSGHPGLPMGMADVAAVLWLKYLRHDPHDPTWADRDRFVLSGGHGSMLLYSLLHLAGYDLPIEELENFRQFGSLTPGHPEVHHTPGVETTTGPLGQGLATAVGMAIAERMVAARFNDDTFTASDHRTFVFCGDGDLMEGVSHEACSLAGHLGLERLVVFYDSNNITIEGRTSLALSDDTKKRFQSYNWHVLECDGHDIAAIDKTIRKALKLAGKPVCVICRTIIGKGSPNKADTAGVHGAPLGDDEVRLAKAALGLPVDESFHVPQAVSDLFAARAKKLRRQANAWKRAFKAWAKANPGKADLWELHMSGKLPADLESLLPVFDPAKAVATRSASGVVINALARDLPNLVGGSADLAPSNMTRMDGLPYVSADDFAGRNFHFGVREFAMAAIMNGIALHGGFRVFGGTFFVFSDYCRPAMRLAALMKLPVIYVFTHDSFYVGEDGPTHQPVEHIASLRCMPNLTVIRPADPTETAAAWAAALRNGNGPTALLLTRQNMQVLDRSVYPAARSLEKGAYVLWQSGAGKPDLQILASGSEVELALAAARELASEANVRVVSMPSWELFEAQSQSYRDKVIHPGCAKRLGIEAACSFGWERYIGAAGEMVSLDTFGASAPGKELARHFGFTVENVLARARALLAE
ncbi:MAG: transketolase [Kiritimatiellia bacterium]|jgi:transketolase